MDTTESQITSLTIVYSTVYSDADQRWYQSSASLAFVRWIHRRPVNSLHKWPVTRKMFPFDDVIMSGRFLVIVAPLEWTSVTLGLINLFKKMQCAMSPWWPFVWLISRQSLFNLNHCNSWHLKKWLWHPWLKTEYYSQTCSHCTEYNVVGASINYIEPPHTMFFGAS